MHMFQNVWSNKENKNLDLNTYESIYLSVLNRDNLWKSTKWINLFDKPMKSRKCRTWIVPESAAFPESVHYFHLVFGFLLGPWSHSCRAPTLCGVSVFLLCSSLISLVLDSFLFKELLLDNQLIIILLLAVGLASCKCNCSVILSNHSI